MAPGEFRRPPQAPPLFVGTKESIVGDTQRIIKTSRGVLDGIVKGVGVEDAGFENVLLPMAWDENAGSLEKHILSFYQTVSPRKELRDASTEADGLLDEFGVESSMRADIFKLVDAVYQKRETLGLSVEENRYVERQRKNFMSYGLGLPEGKERDRFRDIMLRLGKLSIQFQKNLNEEKKGRWYTKEELDGVPEDVVDGFKHGEGENKGKLFVSFEYPDLFPVTKYAKNEMVRKEMTVANENKVLQNVPLFREAIMLRDEAARMLGFKNHAEFRIEDKMLKTPETVNDFLGDLRERLTPGGQKELKVLKEIKKAELAKVGEKFDGHYYLWDHKYYSTMQLERDYQLDQQKISEYFPLQSTLSGMLQIFEELLGLEFFELTGPDRDKLSPTGKGNDIVWHEDVQVFAVWNDESEGGGFVGYLYTDLHPRDDKYGHAANFNIQLGFEQPNGTRRYPVTSLVCNFSKPTVKKPSLLKHGEVTTLFHELGHGIHDLVAKTRFGRFHGTNVVQDFVEAPSQMLENWCWTPSQLRFLSRHYSSLSDAHMETWKSKAPANATPPPKTIPDDLIDSIVNTRHINDAIANLRQLHYGIFDMTVHQPASRKSLEEMDITEVYNKLRADISMTEGPEVQGAGYDWGHGYAIFGHLMGGYDAGYYGYLSSQVYSMDMFHSVFQKDPMNGKEGRRYRHAVLEKGGGRDEMESLKEFLGREPDSAAFYKELGVERRR